MYLIVGNNFHFAVFEHTDTRVSGSQIDTDDSTHRLLILSLDHTEDTQNNYNKNMNNIRLVNTFSIQ